MADAQTSQAGAEIAMLGMTWKVAMSSSIGGAISGVLGAGRWWEKALRGAVGTFVAGIGHHVTAKILVGLLDIPFDAPNLPTVQEMEPIAAFLVGLVGMALCQMAVDTGRRLRHAVPDYVEDKLEGEEAGK